MAKKDFGTRSFSKKTIVLRGLGSTHLKVRTSNPDTKIRYLWQAESGNIGMRNWLERVLGVVVVIRLPECLGTIRSNSGYSGCHWPESAAESRG